MHQLAPRVRDPATLAAELVRGHRRMLCLGPPGIGKSSLAASIAAAARAAGGGCEIIDADPGSPAFGPPACVSRVVWSAGNWRVCDREALASFDAARFRLPLARAVARLCRRAPSTPLLIDLAGVARGMAAAELVDAVLDFAQVDIALVLQRDEAPSFLPELEASGVRVLTLQAHPEAHRLPRQRRVQQRTRAWDKHLRTSATLELVPADLHVVGAPPPPSQPQAWCGRIVGLLDADGATVGLGEIIVCKAGRLSLRATPIEPATVRGLVVRDAGRDASGLVQTVEGRGMQRGWGGGLSSGDTSDMLPRLPPQVALQGSVPPRAHVAGAKAVLVNGVLGDPLLHVRIRHLRRSLLFDLGDAARLQARIAHQVTDVFVTHAHFDHIGGFMWLLRSRIGFTQPCRIYGPAGLTDHILGMVHGICWDRIAARGPCFEVLELHAGSVRRVRVRVGAPAPEPLPAVPAIDGILRREPEFCVRATVLDHGIAVLAYAFEESQHLNIRKEALAARGLQPGAWLGELKRCVGRGELGRRLTLPNGEQASVRSLADALLLVRPGQKLVYATDLADTAANRAALTTLAQGAHTFFCESTFLRADAAQARKTQHLTTRACGEIARAAGVHRLVPFHFSRRYAARPQDVLAEVEMAFAAAP